MQKYWKDWKFPNFKLIRRFQLAGQTNIYDKLKSIRYEEPYDSDNGDYFSIGKIALLKDIIQFPKSRTALNKPFRTLIYINKIDSNNISCHIEYNKRADPSQIAEKIRVYDKQKAEYLRDQHIFQHHDKIGPCHIFNRNSTFESRQSTIAKFSKHNRSILVATTDDLLDMALPEVHLVINYEIPKPSRLDGDYEDLRKRTSFLNKGPEKVIQYWILEDPDLIHASKFVKFLTEESEVYRTSSQTNMEFMVGGPDKEVFKLPIWLQEAANSQNLQEQFELSPITNYT